MARSAPSSPMSRYSPTGTGVSVKEGIQLESNCPIVSQCFQSATYSLSTNPNQVRTVADHAKYLLQLLDKIIEGDVDAEYLREIGANHVSLKHENGFSNTEWDRFQEIMVEVILKQDGVKQSKETSRAWRLLICSFIELIRDGFDAQVRQFRRKHSFNAHVQYFENIEKRVGVCPNRKISLNVDPRNQNNGNRKYSHY
uniref:Globin domain-containing protein n=1 Tax=Caenorhabditis japonica TaxID=281687 RepID=A0A8R1HRI0_CAEJA